MILVSANASWKPTSLALLEIRDNPGKNVSLIFCETSHRLLYKTYDYMSSTLLAQGDPTPNFPLGAIGIVRVRRTSEGVKPTKGFDRDARQRSRLSS